MSEERTIVSSPPDLMDAERTQVAWVPGADVTQVGLVIECPVCQSRNPPGDRWCQDCGFLLSSQAPESLEMPSVSGPRLVLDGREFELRQGANSLGRVGADVLLPDPTVSRHHATLTIDESGAWIEDVGSTNGTSLNGAPLSAGARGRIKDGDTLKLGSVALKLAWSDGPALPAGFEAGGEGGRAHADAAPPVAVLVGEDGREVTLNAGVNTLGRRSENMVALSGDSYASGRHAEIRCDSGGCVLVDIGSTNGTFLRREGAAEAERLRPHDPQSLAPGDEVRIGQSTFVFQLAPSVPVETPVSDEEQRFAPPSGETDAAEAADPPAESHAEGVIS
jgi:pSer/pThr/pTyr-binding forkhead associated (FHA) protein